MKEKAFLILLFLSSIITASPTVCIVNANPTIYSEHEIQLQDKFEPWLWDKIQRLEANGTTRYYSLVIRLDPEKIATTSGEDYKKWTATFLSEGHGAITNYICNVFPVIIVKVNATQIKDVAAYDFVLHIGDGEAKGSLTLDVSVPTIEADDVHSMGFTGLGVNAGITDTGIDDSHPVFQGKTIIFRDFHAGTPEVIKQPWETGDRPDIYDYAGHGTHVASILAGDDPDDVYDGVAFGVDTLIIASLGTGEYDPTDPSSVQAGEDEYIAALDWLVHRGAQVISSSWGWQRRWESPGWYCDGTCEVCRAADDVVDNGVVMVQAAGNEGLPGSQFAGSPYAVTDDGYSSLRCPATAFNVITVGASNDNDTPDIGDDTIAYFTPSQWPPYGWASSRGPTADGRPKPDVVAPGVNVYSADPVGSAGYYPGDWGDFSGTSAATPHVAGVAALLLEAFHRLALIEGQKENRR